MTDIKMTQSLAGAFGCAAMLTLGIGATPAHAEDYPSHPIRLIVAQAPGSGVDLVARKVAEKMTAGLGTSVYVENRPGANGIIGTDYVAKSKPDGYTVLAVVPSTMTVNPFMYDHLPYDPFKDFTAVAQTHIILFGLVVNAASPIKTVADVIRLAKTKPGGLNYSSGGIGNLNQLGAELFAANAHIKMQQIPNRGEGPAIVDLVSGQTDLMFSTLPTAAPLIASGQLRLIATMGKTRDRNYPNVPTFVELGFPAVVVEGWEGLVVPKNTPAAIVAKLQQEVVKDLQDADLRKAIRELGGEPVGSNSAVFARFMQDDATKWQGVIQATGLKAQLQ
jgi:tripartite-type tricarboxylate transporter receptor subunit TctC